VPRALGVPRYFWHAHIIPAANIRGQKRQTQGGNVSARTIRWDVGLFVASWEAVSTPHSGRYSFSDPYPAFSAAVGMHPAVFRTWRNGARQLHHPAAGRAQVRCDMAIPTHRWHTDFSQGSRRDDDHIAGLLAGRTQNNAYDPSARAGESRASKAEVQWELRSFVEISIGLPQDHVSAETASDGGNGGGIERRV
jgi:hypothetical protein